MDTATSKLWYGRLADPLLGNAWTIKDVQSCFKRNLSDADLSGSMTFDGEHYKALFDFHFKKKDGIPGEFSLDAKPDGVTQVNTDYIGQYVQLDVDMKQDPTNLAAWDKFLDQGNINAALNITRNPGGEAISIVNSPIQANGTPGALSKAQLMDLFRGNTKLSFADNTTMYPIALDETVKFTYTATLSVSVDGRISNLNPNPGTDIATFYRPPNNKSHFTSSPKYWSEIKEGSPLNETFEAMSGVPTTRNLYFASGGSEFIVDIETEYVKDATSTRNYTDSFTSVQCDKYKCTPDQHTVSDGHGGTTTYTDHCKCHHHYVSDTWSWSQTANYDYTKINNLKVWKLDKSKVNGMTKLIGTDEVTASVQSGDPTLFYNIAGSNTSSAGRLRYSLNTDQHDDAGWSQSSNNSCTGHTAANMAIMNSHKALTTNVTAVSDFIILQTTRGDQSVMYYQATSNTARTDQALLIPKTSKEAQWDNNPNSAAAWDYMDTIAIGSYNGNYASPNTKYESGGGGTVSTIFDTFPAGFSRKARPDGGMRLWQGNLGIRDTIPNQEYVTGSSTVFYKNLVNYGPGATPYSLNNDAKYGMVGQRFNSTYSPNHAKVNDVVVHNPVSTEYAMIMPLPADRDQRSVGSAIGQARQGGTTCPGSPADCEFRILDCHYSGGTSHTAACYTGINVTGSNNTHVHTSSCGYNAVGYWTCNNLPLNSGASYQFYHPSGCSHSGAYCWSPVSNYDQNCSYGHNSCSYWTGVVSYTTHVHNASCNYVPAGWTCNSLPLNSHVHGPSCGCINTTILNCKEPHHMGMHYDVGNPTCYRACMNDANHAAKATISIPGQGTFTPGKFINLDYGFTVYFPNQGSFYGNGALGIGETSAIPGKGFTTPMNTTEWTKEKSVYFDFNVIFNGRMYRAGEKVALPVPQDTYVFYCPLGNHELKDAKVRYEVEAINQQQPVLDNTKMLNRLRDGTLRAKHSGVKNTTIDVVGRIGNMTIEDTGDFRFSNLLKAAKVPLEWYVPNVVKKVDTSKQNKIIADTWDIRGLQAGASTHWLNTYGFQSQKEQNPILFPLSPEKNNIPALRRQPLRIGYQTFADIETIGDYYNDMQIIFYYYKLDLVTKAITPVDVYMNVGGQYKPINIFGAAVVGWDPKIVHNNQMSLAWEDECERRNYSIEEKAITEQVFKFTGHNIPAGMYYTYGNNQVLFPTERNRTFIGNTATYASDMNPGNRVDIALFNQQAQRWHFTYGLPSSAMFVGHGLRCIQANTDAVMNNNSVILTAVDILSVGNVFNLNYKFKAGNQPVVINGVIYPTVSIPYPVVQVTSSNKSSATDLSIKGTH